MSGGKSGVITRRQALGIAGAAGAAAVVAKVAPGGGDAIDRATGTEVAQAATPSCVLTPEKTEGPYFVDEKLNRSDIRESQAGTALKLAFTVVDVDGSCAPVEGAVVDIWHANSGGKYSDEAVNSTSGQEWLRGLQYTDANGKCVFTTIFPGWYEGRAVHIHFKVRQFSGSRVTHEFNSQLFFDPNQTSQVYSSGAYATRGQAAVSNSEDNIYGANGSQLVMPLTASGGGYAGSYVIGLSGFDASSGGEANSVDAAVKSMKWRRTASGRRVLRVRLDLDEKVTVRGRITRSGKTVAYRARKGVKKGSRLLDIPVSNRRRGGKAKVTLSFTDSAGKVKRRTRKVRVPTRL